MKVADHDLVKRPAENRPWNFQPVDLHQFSDSTSWYQIAFFGICIFFEVHRVCSFWVCSRLTLGRSWEIQLKATMRRFRIIHPAFFQLSSKPSARLPVLRDDVRRFPSNCLFNIVQWAVTLKIYNEARGKQQAREWKNTLALSKIDQTWSNSVLHLKPILQPFTIIWEKKHAFGPLGFSLLTSEIPLVNLVPRTWHF